jgi:hypothetical protein
MRYRERWLGNEETPRKHQGFRRCATTTATLDLPCE